MCIRDSRWIEKGGLELLPLGRDELVRAIDWIEKYADRPLDPVSYTHLDVYKRQIVECLAEHAATVTDPSELARRIRTHLPPALVQQIYGAVKELDVIALEPDLERLVTQALTSPHGAALDPGVADTLSLIHI